MRRLASAGLKAQATASHGSQHHNDFVEDESKMGLQYNVVIQVRDYVIRCLVRPRGRV